MNQAIIYTRLSSSNQSFNNGVYLYKLSTSNSSHSGRLVVNK